MDEIRVPLTEKENAALIDLSKRQELSPERVMIQALRLYQFVALGRATVTMPEDENRCTTWDPTQ